LCRSCSVANFGPTFGGTRDFSLSASSAVVVDGDRALCSSEESFYKDEDNSVNHLGSDRNSVTRLNELGSWLFKTLNVFPLEEKMPLRSSHFNELFIVNRGGCLFEEKSRNGHSRGAKAIIVKNSEVFLCCTVNITILIVFNNICFCVGRKMSLLWQVNWKVKMRMISFFNN
jgi:hypothetical protein